LRRRIRTIRTIRTTRTTRTIRTTRTTRTISYFFTVKVAGDLGLDLEAGVLIGLDRLGAAERERAGAALAPFLDLADGPEQVGLDRDELVVGDFAHLALHLGFQQAIAQCGVVVQLGLGGGKRLVEGPADAADQEGVQEEHVAGSR